jgi:hypothetical protein
MVLIRSAFWFALFVASTFCFIVLFEHGTSNFVENSKKEVNVLKAMFVPGFKKPVNPAK